MEMGSDVAPGWVEIEVIQWLGARAERVHGWGADGGRGGGRSSRAGVGAEVTWGEVSMCLAGDGCR